MLNAYHYVNNHKSFIVLASDRDEAYRIYARGEGIPIKELATVYESQPPQATTGE